MQHVLLSMSTRDPPIPCPCPVPSTGQINQSVELRAARRTERTADSGRSPAGEARHDLPVLEQRYYSASPFGAWRPCRATAGRLLLLTTVKPVRMTRRPAGLVWLAGQPPGRAGFGRMIRTPPRTVRGRSRWTVESRLAHTSCRSMLNSETLALGALDLATFYNCWLYTRTSILYVRARARQTKPAHSY
jgi:hypothetical protein